VGAVSVAFFNHIPLQPPLPRGCYFLRFRFSAFFPTFVCEDKYQEMELSRRQNGDSSTDRFLNLISDPFQAEVSCGSLRE
jgi:hypothetical protein